jgi:hypothetical protein
MRTLQRRMPDTGVPPVVVPQTEQDWVSSAAARTTRALTRAGYPVVGDLADLAPRAAVPTGLSRHGGADDRQVLELAIRMIVDPGWRSGRETSSERRVER